MDPFVGKRVTARRDDRVPERNRPPVLDQRDRGPALLGNHVGEIPGVLLVEEVPVLELRGAGKRTGLHALLAVGPESDQGADEHAELDGLVLREVARLERLELPVALRHDQKVDEPYEAGICEPPELRQDLAREALLVGGDDEHLHRSERDGVVGRVVGAHVAPRIFCFCCSNSSSVRTPSCLSLASCWGCAIALSVRPPAGAAGGAAAGAAAAAYCWLWRSSICASCASSCADLCADLFPTM